MISFRPSLWRRLVFVIVVVGLVARASAQEKQPARTTLPPGFIGSWSCKDCHQEIYKNFATTPHWKIAFDKRDAATATGQCESCHGPGREHVQSGGDPAKIVSFKGASADKIPATCLGCHQYRDQPTHSLPSPPTTHYH